MVASDTPKPVEQRLQEWDSRLHELSAEKPPNGDKSSQEKAGSLIASARLLNSDTDKTAEQVVRDHSGPAAAGGSSGGGATDLVVAKERQLASILQELFDLYGDPVAEVMEMEEVTVNFSSIPSKKGRPPLDKEEMKRQLREGQAVLDGMTIKQWLANRDTFRANKAAATAKGRANPEGRDPEGTRLQAAAKRKAIAAEAARLANDNPTLTSEEALEQAEENLKTKVATHKLDQVAGGSGTALSEDLGEAREDFAIGAAWPSKAKKIEERVKDLPEEAKEQRMRVKITLDGEPLD
jgi:hypothetical protein